MAEGSEEGLGSKWAVVPMIVVVVAVCVYSEKLLMMDRGTVRNM